MYVLAVTMYEFRQFLQLLMWVALPLVIIATLITIFVHYWRKKRNREAGPDLLPESDTDVMPQIAEPPVEGQQGYKGVLWLRNKYEQDIEQAAQKHDQLKGEYHKLEKRYQELLDKTSVIPETTETTTKLDNPEKVQEYEETIRQLNNAAAEKDRQLENLQNELAELRQTNASLKTNEEPVPVYEGNQSERSILEQELLMAQHEKAALKTKLIEQESLQDLLQEKTTQIHFLENQLEQRIKIFHEVEFQGREDANRVKDLSDKVTLVGREKQELSENLQEQSDRILQLENELQTLSREHVNIQNELNESIHFQAREAKELGARLEFSNRLLRKLQREINASLESQFVLNPDAVMPVPDQSKPKISAWIESPSEEEFEHII